MPTISPVGGRATLKGNVRKPILIICQLESGMLNMFYFIPKITYLSENKEFEYKFCPFCKYEIN